jgi:hypothetical protein
MVPPSVATVIMLPPFEQLLRTPPQFGTRLSSAGGTLKCSLKGADRPKMLRVRREGDAARQRAVADVLIKGPHRDTAKVCGSSAVEEPSFRFGVLFIHEVTPAVYIHAYPPDS